MNNLLKNTARFILFLLVQIVILNEVPPIHQFITPIFILCFYCGCLLEPVALALPYLDLYSVTALIYLPKPWTARRCLWFNGIP